MADAPVIQVNIHAPPSDSLNTVMLWDRAILAAPVPDLKACLLVTLHNKHPIVGIAVGRSSWMLSHITACTVF